MHELSLASSMLNAVADAMPQGARLAKVHVTIGPLSGVSPDSLDFCFGELARQRGFQDARLLISRTAAHAKCISCGDLYALDRFDVPCPQCGAFDRDIESGAEFTLDSIELEEL
jgi:hydrogenase nickel incorporation protein HypA/HybF